MRKSKKQIKPESSVITHIAGRLINVDGETVSEFSEAPGTMSEEDQTGFLNLAKKVLSGNIGKTLSVLELPMNAEEDDSLHDRLQTLRMDAEKWNLVFDRLTESLTEPEDYLILLIRGVYDIPGRGSDDEEMADTGSDVYTFVIAAICPMTKSKPSLVFDIDERNISTKFGDFVIGAPLTGFLFPAFTDRQTDIHSVLMYQKPGDANKALAEEIITNDWLVMPPMSGEEQTEVWKQTLDAAFDGAPTLSELYDLNERIAEVREANGEEIPLSAEDQKAALEQAGGMAEIPENRPLYPVNLIPSGTWNFTTDTAKLQVKGAYAHQVEAVMINGRKCLVIPIEGELSVNDILVQG